LLGLAFSFDAINGERAEGTLPRLLSQPIHRDDVDQRQVRGRLASSRWSSSSWSRPIAAFALIRLGIVPEAGEVLRCDPWLLVTGVYISLWLAFGLLLSVASAGSDVRPRRFGTWLLLSFFGGLIVSLLGALSSPRLPAGRGAAPEHRPAGDAPTVRCRHALPRGVAVTDCSTRRSRRCRHPPRSAS
jgi:ABC-2 type transport system permease protein